VPDRVAHVVSKVFGIPADQVTNDTSPDNVKLWDSLQHLNLVMALEAEFGISLSPEEAMEMLSVGLIRMALRERGVPALD
jgi:acyl carrier protein